MRTPSSAPRATSALLIAMSAVLLSCALFACAANDDGRADWAYDGLRPRAYDDLRLVAAEKRLQAHDLERARLTYQAILDTPEQAPGAHATARVGASLMDLLLLPDHPSVRAVLRDHLGAENPNYSTQRLIWAEQGMLSWISTNVRWEDSGMFRGVRSLVAPELPWAVSRLESADAFAAPLTQPLSSLALSLIPVALRLAEISAALRQAFSADHFEAIYLPAEVFHDDRLSFTLGVQELRLISACLHVAQAAIYWLASYDHDYSLAQLLSPGAWQPILDDPAHPEHDPSLARAEDYAARALDRGLLRQAEPATQRLAAASLASALDSLKAMFAGAIVYVSNRSLRLVQISVDQYSMFNQLFRALRSALDVPTPVPFTSPTLTLNLAPLFQGRTLDPAISWWRDVDPADPDAPRELNPEALQALFVDGVIVSPSLSLPHSEPLPTLTIAEDGSLEAALRTIAGHIVDSILEAYNLQ